MQTIFITGAGGFVGSRLLTALREAGYDVVAGVRNRARKLAFERDNTHALVCNVTDSINVARAIASVRPDAVVHLAGPARPGEATADPLGAYQGIVSSWANVLDAVRRSVPRAKVVLASASDVYGQAGSDGTPLPETTPLAPVTTFGSLKQAAENIAATFFRDYHLDITIARPFQYTGPGQGAGGYFAAAAMRLAEAAERSDNELHWPDLQFERDVLHVDDVIRAYVCLIENGQPNEAYNVCSGELRSCRGLLETMITAQGQAIELRDLPMDGDQPAISRLCGDAGKLRALGWTPAHSPEDAVRGLVAAAPEAISSAN